MRAARGPIERQPMTYIRKLIDRATCPDCGIPTVPDHAGLTHDETLCDTCFARHEARDLDHIPERN